MTINITHWLIWFMGVVAILWTNQNQHSMEFEPTRGELLLLIWTIACIIQFNFNVLTFTL